MTLSFSWVPKFTCKQHCASFPHVIGQTFLLRNSWMWPLRLTYRILYSLYTRRVRKPFYIYFTWNYRKLSHMKTTLRWEIVNHFLLIETIVFQGDRTINIIYSAPIMLLLPGDDMDNVHIWLESAASDIFSHIALTFSFLLNCSFFQILRKSLWLSFGSGRKLPIVPYDPHDCRISFVNDFMILMGLELLCRFAKLSRCQTVTFVPIVANAIWYCTTVHCVQVPRTWTPVKKILVVLLNDNNEKEFLWIFFVLKKPAHSYLRLNMPTREH